VFGLIFGLVLMVSPVRGQDSTSEWQAQVRKYAQAQDWDSALRVVDREIARAPQDMDVRAWRARVLAWSGGLAEAEKEYLAILKVLRNDPDNWMGLASVYSREGKTEEALRALDVAVELDPKRADLHAARARALRATGSEAKLASNFRKLWIWIPPTQKRTPGCYRRATSQDTHYGSAKATTSLISRGPITTER